MSYERMAQEDFCCDFPGCDDRFDQRKGAEIAVIKDNRVLAFCSLHGSRLRQEGVPLRTIEAVQAEMEERENGPKKRREEAKRAAREQNFINSLKS